jgi:hypothetical protein
MCFFSLTAAEEAPLIIDGWFHVKLFLSAIVELSAPPDFRGIRASKIDWIGAMEAPGK